MSIAIDIILIVVVALCIWTGYKKGFVMGVGNILMVVISLYAANLLANMFSYEVVSALRPFASGYMESLMVGDVRNNMGLGESDYSIDDYLKQNPDELHKFTTECYKAAGIYKTSADKIGSKAENYAQTNNVDIKEAVCEELALEASFVVAFILAFLLILILLTVIGNIPNLSFRIPNADKLNCVGGIVTGAVTGFAFCIVIVWVLKFTGIVIGTGTLEKTYIASALTKADILMLFMGI